MAKAKDVATGHLINISLMCTSDEDYVRAVGAHGPSTLRKHGLPPDVDAGQGVGQGSQRWTGVGLRKDVG